MDVVQISFLVGLDEADFLESVVDYGAVLDLNVAAKLLRESEIEQRSEAFAVFLPKFVVLEGNVG